MPGFNSLLVAQLSPDPRGTLIGLFPLMKDLTMRIRLVLAALVLVSASVLSQSPAMAASVVLGESCSTLGATAMSDDHTAILLCAFPSPSTAIDCASGGGCVWTTISGNSGGSGCFIYHCGGFGGTPCKNNGGKQGYCPSPILNQSYYLGDWGFCIAANAQTAHAAYRPPSGGCSDPAHHNVRVGNAYVCCFK